MKYNNDTIRQLKTLYRKKKREIVSRLGEFRRSWTHMNDEEIFTELAFCILTPQSKAKFCWDAIKDIRKHNLLLRGTAGQIRNRLYRVRFHNKKSDFFVRARSFFMHDGAISIKPDIGTFSDTRDCREWLVKHIKGLSYKEASHFLRNIGFGDNIAILDRHILKNLHQMGVIEKICADRTGNGCIRRRDTYSSFPSRPPALVHGNRRDIQVTFGGKYFSAVHLTSCSHPSLCSSELTTMMLNILR
jgi:N-glycosylase/DNA lyase